VGDSKKEIELGSL